MYHKDHHLSAMLECDPSGVPLPPHQNDLSTLEVFVPPVVLRNTCFVFVVLASLTAANWDWDTTLRRKSRPRRRSLRSAEPRYHSWRAGRIIPRFSPVSHSNLSIALACISHRALLHPRLVDDGIVKLHLSFVFGLYCSLVPWDAPQIDEHWIWMYEYHRECTGGAARVTSV